MEEPRSKTGILTLHRKLWQDFVQGLDKGPRETSSSVNDALKIRRSIKPGGHLPCDHRPQFRCLRGSTVPSTRRDRDHRPRTRVLVGRLDDKSCLNHMHNLPVPRVEEHGRDRLYMEAQLYSINGPHDHLLKLMRGETTTPVFDSRSAPTAP